MFFQTCLSLAVMANNRKFLSHPISQIILGDLWMGGLRMRRNPGFKIILGLLLPPTIVHLEFKTKEELELMPQTEEEFLVQEEQEEDTSSHSSTKPSDMESVGRGSFQQESQVLNVGMRNKSKSNLLQGVSPKGEGGQWFEQSPSPHR